MLACLSGWYGAEEHLSVPLALRQRRLQTKIQKEGRCEEDQPSRAHRKLRVHRKRINKRYAARERCASIPILYVNDVSGLCMHNTALPFSAWL